MHVACSMICSIERIWAAERWLNSGMLCANFFKLMLVYFGAAGEASGQPTERAIIHLDMDCFFASVAGLTHAAFDGKPLAVSHSNSAQGTGEISSANYEARKFGIKASMFIAEAKKRCPHLIVMPYQFDKYEDVSEQVGLH